MHQMLKRQEAHNIDELIPICFFAYGNGLYLEPIGKGRTEVASSTHSLSEDTHSFLLFCRSKTIGVVIADGGQSASVIIEEVDATRKLWRVFLLSINSMISRYDSASAKENEEFWNLRDRESAIEKKKKINPSVFNNEKTSYGT